MEYLGEKHFSAWNMFYCTKDTFKKLDKYKKILA